MPGLHEVTDVTDRMPVLLVSPGGRLTHLVRRADLYQPLPEYRRLFPRGPWVSCKWFCGNSAHLKPSEIGFLTELAVLRATCTVCKERYLAKVGLPSFADARRAAEVLRDMDWSSLVAQP